MNSSSSFLLGRSSEQTTPAPLPGRGFVSERSPSTAQPPLTNRGVILTEAGQIEHITVRPDFMTGTTRMPLDEVKNYLSAVLGASEWLDFGHGGYGYGAISTSAYGAKLYYTAGREDILVWIPGKACQYLGDAGVISVREYLDLSLTRLDIAFDYVGVSPSMLRDAFKASQVNTRVRSNSSKWIEDGDGFQTFYIGSGKSDRTICCYNMRGYNRLELRLRHDYAQATANTLKYLYEEKDRLELYMSLVTGFVDFVDRTADTNVSRCPRLDWWAEFVGGVERMRFALEKKVQMAEEFVSNVVTRMTASFACAAKILAAQSNKHVLDVVSELFATGCRREKPKHKVLLGYFKEPSPQYSPF